MTAKKEHARKQGMRLLEFIKARPEFNRRALARRIDWNPTSMHLWLTYKRPIPARKAERLAEVLSDYGFRVENTMP